MAATSGSDSSAQRLQKVLAAAGVASRRECEQWILDGRVEVDREIVTELGTRVDPDAQEIRVDGAPITIKRRSYYLLNKPPGVVCTNADPEGRPRVIDLIDSDERLFPVGRLDRSSEGLMLVTNDGELANQLAHPRFGVEKTYLATVVGRPTNEQLQQLRDGVFLAEGKASVVSVRVKKRRRDQTVLEIVLNEGRNREIRRLLARVGHKVVKLKRTAVGAIQLGDVPMGAHRRLSSHEVTLLKRLANPRRRSTSGSRGKRRGASRTGEQRGGRKAAAGSSSAKRKRSVTPRLPSSGSTGAVIGGDAAGDEKSSAGRPPRKTVKGKRQGNAAGRKKAARRKKRR